MLKIAKYIRVPLALVTISVGLLAQTGSSVTVWKLNVSKSKFEGRGPLTMTRTVKSEGAVTTLSFEGIGADGNRMSYSYETRFDDKDYPVSGAAPAGIETMAVKRVDAKTMQATGKKAGKIVVTATNVLSDDGKMLTATTKGTEKDGRMSTSVAVWDKQ
jgi:hypothetical protein